MIHVEPWGKKVTTDGAYDCLTDEAKREVLVALSSWIKEERKEVCDHRDMRQLREVPEEGLLVSVCNDCGVESHAYGPSWKEKS